MKREDLKIGDKVTVKPHPEKVLYVRELHNPKVAGLAYGMDRKTVFGVYYDVLQPIKTN